VRKINKECLCWFVSNHSRISKKNITMPYKSPKQKVAIHLVASLKNNTSAFESWPALRDHTIAPNMSLMIHFS
jgi:hypothetical protein